MHSPAIDFGRLSDDNFLSEGGGEAPVKLHDSPTKHLPYQSCSPSTSDSAIKIDDLLEDNWKWSRRLSKEVSVKEAQFHGKNVVFHPNYAWGSVAARGEKRLLKNMIAYWKIHVPNVYGTSMMFGIGSKAAKISAPINFEHLLGNIDGQSWGLSHDGKTRYNGKEEQFCPAFGDHNPANIGILFNGINRTLSFSIDNGPFIVAFTDLNLDRILYPMVSSTAQRSLFIVVDQRCKVLPQSLTNCCIEMILHQMHPAQSIEDLPLPPHLKKVLAIRWTVKNRRKNRSHKRLDINVGKILKKITVA